MIKTCRCGKSYDAGLDIAPFPVCPACAKQWDDEIESRLFVPEETPVNDDDKLDALGIRPRHYSCTFDNFTPRNDVEKNALATCKRMADSRRGIIVLIGNNGTGKTHLACSTVRSIGSGRIYKMIELGMFIRRAFNSDGKICEQDQLDALIKLPFLGIDEFDKSKKTDNEFNWLSYLIDERNERHRPTMIIGNCHPRSTHKDERSCEKCFETIMTPDVLDRIAQYGVIRYFDGESHRAGLRGNE